MSIDRERVTLSAGERERFADLEAALSRDDPDLVALAHPRRRVASLGPAAHLALAAVLVACGSGLMLATFVRWLWIALFGVALQAVGIRTCLDPIRRIRSNRRPLPESPG